MVDRADLSTITSIYDQLGLIDRALENLSEGGRIIAMTISGPDVPQPEPGQPPIFGGPLAVIIQVGDIDYPPAMNDAIREALMQKEDRLNSELSEMGVTGSVQPRSGAVSSGAPLSAAADDLPAGPPTPRSRRTRRT